MSIADHQRLKQLELAIMRVSEELRALREEIERLKKDDPNARYRQTARRN